VLISKIEFEKYPEAGVLLSIVVDIMLAASSIWLAMWKPFFYAVNVVGSFILCVVLDHSIRFLLREGDQRVQAIAEKMVTEHAASPKDIEAFKNGKPTLKEWLQFTGLSIAWFAYTVWYSVYFGLLFIKTIVIEFRKRMSDD